MRKSETPHTWEFKDRKVKWGIYGIWPKNEVRCTEALGVEMSFAG